MYRLVTSSMVNCVIFAGLACVVYMQELRKLSVLDFHVWRVEGGGCCHQRGLCETAPNGVTLSRVYMYLYIYMIVHGVYTHVHICIQIYSNYIYIYIQINSLVCWRLGATDNNNWDQWQATVASMGGNVST